MDRQPSPSRNISVGRKSCPEKRVSFVCSGDIPVAEDTCEGSGKKSEECRIGKSVVKRKRTGKEDDPSGSSVGSRSAAIVEPRLPSSIGILRGAQHGDRRRYQDRRRRGRDRSKLSARCSSRISQRRAGLRLLRGRCARYPRQGGRSSPNAGCISFSSNEQQPQQAQQAQQLLVNDALPVVEEPSGNSSPSSPSLPSSPSSSSPSTTARKRRVGIVENHYCRSPRVPIAEGKLEKERAGNAVCALTRDLERLLGNGESMKSKKQQEPGGLSESVDPSEANETYDEFDAARMPMVRALSKSPQSDEGIETDSERRRGSIARCWSLDSTAASDEDASHARHKLRVTRCCSSDSAILSDEDQIKGWENLCIVEVSETEHPEGRPRYWRTPSVVVSDYSDYSYLDEKLERSDLDFEKYDGTSGSPSQASSCSCLDCDEIRESLDNQFLQVCWSRRHSDSCCLCLDSSNTANIRNLSETGNRRNSCLESTATYYSKFDSQLLQYSHESSTELQEKGKIEHLGIPPARKISDCSTTSSLSGDECDVSELLEVKPARSSGWRKLRNIVHWTPFFQTYKKQRYPWVQLAGHQGNFRAGPTPGTILKKLCPQEEACFRLLMNDILKPYVPEFKGVLDIRETEEGNTTETGSRDGSQKENSGDPSNKRTIVSSYLQLQDLLGDFEHPCVMDCKVGVRTYLESELAKAKERPKLRKDMYEKMVQVDPSAPSAEERRMQGVTKPRYMVWRETISSTATLGFRVEGIKLAHGGSSKDFKTTRTREQVTEALRRFVEGYPHVVPKYLQRLKAIRATLKASPFFATHEVVGSSLLFVHDTKNAGVWMIDFAKTLPLPQHLPRIQHDAEWQVGNHEDGYLIGVNNLIEIFQDIRNSET